MPKNNKVQRHLAKTFENKKHHYEKKVTSSSAVILNFSPKKNSATSTLITLLLLSSCVASAYADCNPPGGTYKKTCDIKGQEYHSSDDNLKDVAMCKFDMHCKKTDGTTSVKTSIYVQKSMIGCLRFFENCNGQPVLRDSVDASQCENADVAFRDSKKKIDL